MKGDDQRFAAAGRCHWAAHQREMSALLGEITPRQRVWCCSGEPAKMNDLEKGARPAMLAGRRKQAAAGEQIALVTGAINPLLIGE